MANDPLAFLDENDTSNDPLSFLDKKDTPKWKKEASFEKFISSKAPKGRNILADAITSGTALAGGLGDIASVVGIDNPLTSESLRKKAFEFAPSLAPKNEKEREWDEGLSTVMGLFSPIGGATKLAGKAVGKLGGNAVSKALKGKYREMYNIGKDLGIAEEALAPFKHGKVTESVLKNLSKLGEEAKQGIKFAEDLATPMYDKIFEAGSKIPVNKISQRGVVKGLENIVTEIQKSPALVSESKDVVKFLQEAVHGIESNPNLNVENLMALQKALGKTVNWSSIKQAGKGRLVQEAKSAVEKGIYGMNPMLGKQLTQMDKLYSGYKKLAKEVSPSKLLGYASKGGPLGYVLLSVLTGHDFQDASMKAAQGYFGTKALGKISGKLLTDPKWVGIKEKIVSMIKKGSTEHLPKMLVALKKKANMEIPYFDLEEETSQQ